MGGSGAALGALGGESTADCDAEGALACAKLAVGTAFSFGTATGSCDGFFDVFLLAEAGAAAGAAD